MRTDRDAFRKWGKSDEQLKRELSDIERSIEDYSSKRRTDTITTLLQAMITKRHEIMGKLARRDMEREYLRKQEERKKRREQRRERERRKAQEKANEGFLDSDRDKMNRV